MKVKIEKQRVMVRLPTRLMLRLEKWAEDNCTNMTAEIVRCINGRIEAEQRAAG
jgi:hypothetical protein